MKVLESSVWRGLFQLQWLENSILACASLLAHGNIFQRVMQFFFKIIVMYLLLEYPMKAGLIENWSDVEDIWDYMLCNELGIEEGNHPILITEVANMPKKNREKIAEVRPML